MKPGEKDKPKIFCLLSWPMQSPLLVRGIVEVINFLARLFKVAYFNSKELGSQKVIINTWKCAGEILEKFWNFSVRKSRNPVHKVPMVR